MAARALSRHIIVVDTLKSWIYRLALKRQDGERALMNAPERLTPYEALQSFDAERELAKRQ